MTYRIYITIDIYIYIYIYNYIYIFVYIIIHPLSMLRDFGLSMVYKLNLKLKKKIIKSGKLMITNEKSSLFLEIFEIGRPL